MFCYFWPGGNERSRDVCMLDCFCAASCGIYHFCGILFSHVSLICAQLCECCKMASFLSCVKPMCWLFTRIIADLLYIVFFSMTGSYTDICLFHKHCFDTITSFFLPACSAINSLHVYAFLRSELLLRIYRWRVCSMSAELVFSPTLLELNAC